MGRHIDDDFPRRIANADAALAEGEGSADEPRTVRYLTVAVRNMERAIAKTRFITRTQRVCVVVGVVALLAGAAGTILAWGTSLPFLKPAIGCGLVALLAAALWIGVWDRPRDAGDGQRTVFKPLPELEALAEALRSELAMARAQEYPELGDRRSRYRDDVRGIIQQYQGESRHYRRVHNTLQTVIMVGSAIATTASSLDTEPLNWQRITTIAVSFTITVSAAITGYYKYRERAYFLQQTADAVEEQLNGYEYGVGDYQDDDQDAALARLTQNVEGLRNEQRRRQQQLDQPTEQATTGSQPSA
ncbi:DUF4231 domain-containing protein [Streptomyces sp. HUAS TT20]|uniref:DUF4231 domain-containing protein n=1 Tax=Streptomyces sp. HUAS TT20 TaxID=3447509 RepID=UPI0021D96028|nr:DUF4231 domain-containing protein [Streptomyces sp. HUAS 15-9]UXY33242.1 DUF4231 domain-containing protein [Streptomyces sp. HUAS 15-9]